MALPFGKYQLLKKLAAGGMGQVFLARSAGAQGFEKLLVIKRILPHLVEDEEFLAMFFDEARIAARLNHPNVVQIFDLGEAAGSHYLAMEYVAGEDLRRLDKQARSAGKMIPLGLLCRIIADAAAGLDYAHKARDAKGQPMQLVHRDVSPQNVLVGFDGAVKLIDFGVARAAGRMQHTATGVLKGKYAYMSPEQVDGLPVDHRSDIFALGIVFWEMLVGKRLFKGDSEAATMRLVKECRVPAPSTVNPQLPPQLDKVVMTALAAEPQRRYPDAAAFRMAIENFCLAQHLPATSAHLAAFMNEIYAERIAQEAQPVDELTASTGLDLDAVAPAKSGSRDSSKSRVPTGLRPTAERAALQAQAQGGWNWGRLAVAAIVLLGGIGGGVYWLMNRHGPEPVATPGPATPQKDPGTTVAPPPQLPPPATDILVRLRSVPGGADVFEGESQIGTTPVDVKLSKEKHALSFRLKGYQAAARPLDLSHLASSDTQLEVTLEKMAGKKPKGGDDIKIFQ